MAKLQMQRINICALKKNRKAILERLQELGAMELDIRLEDDSGYIQQDIGESKAEFDRNVHTIERALEISALYAPQKKGLLDALAGKKLVEKSDFQKIIDRQDTCIQTADEMVALDKKISEAKAGNLKMQNQIESLRPWMSLTVPVGYEGTERTSVIIGMMAASYNLEQIYTMIKSTEPEVEAVDVDVIYSDKEYIYIAVVCLTEDSQTVEDALRAHGFARPSQHSDEIPANFKKELEEKIKSNEDEILKCEHEIVSLAEATGDLEILSDYYRIRSEKYEFLGALPQTEHTFAVSGYIPAYRAASVAGELEQNYGAAVELEDVKEDEDSPVLLKNGKFTQSIDSVLSSFGLPGKDDIDPSTLTAIFYVFLFGLMLSDAAYGLIITIACGAAILKFPRMEENLKKSVQLFFWCGISTFVWGVLFGGYFGDAINVISRVYFGHEVSIPALWFVPLNDPMRLLVYSMLFGVIHLFTGLALKGYICLKHKRYLDFVCDCVLWFLLLIGLIGILLPTDLFAGIAGQAFVFPAFVNTGAKVFAIVGAIGILLMSGRANKNPGVRIALGAYDLYNITGWLSDVLSYSRLLALGLATGVIASVVNQMGSMVGTSVIGVIAFIIIFIVGHILNLAINLLGAYVHTCRLQYVEFFGKFYEGNGRPFNPFNLKTKYIDIKEEK